MFQDDYGRRFCCVGNAPFRDNFWPQSTDEFVVDLLCLVASGVGALVFALGRILSIMEDERKGG
jgi:hypothetical protein